ncbi:MAG: ABC transporter ATP-binding protein [Clostridiaceae bacterium]|jgi:ABC-2 type transport system ATP-binding protein|nr:ABC transporter ATP-binding protein [Clostridiaceae bacterium]
MKDDMTQQDDLQAVSLSAIKLSKHFGPVKALDQVSCQIAGASIFGLIGSNGAGKSTFLRLAAGVYKPTGGQILYGDQAIYENAGAKQTIQFVADQPYFHFDRLGKMAALFRSLYLDWDQAFYQELLQIFPLKEDDRLDRMSRGMQRQAALILAMAANPKLLLMDEAFDGLDPVMRQNLKKILARQVSDRQMTVLIASQNLRELEDFCDHVGLLHQGGLLFVEELDKLRLSTVKVQLAFREGVSQETLRDLGLDILQFKTRGSLIEILARGSQEEVSGILAQKDPLILDILPLSLEEVFIYELSLKAYQVSDLLA